MHLRCVKRLSQTAGARPSYDQKTDEVNDYKSNDYSSLSVIVLVLVLVVLGVVFLVVVAIAACRYFYYH